MKTKEIDCYVSPDWETATTAYAVISGPCRADSIRAKLIIEIPDKKITISESEFDHAVSTTDSGACIYPLVHSKKLKERLFGKGGEG